MKIYIIKDYGVYSGDLDCSINVFPSLQKAKKNFLERIKEVLQFKEVDNIEYNTDYKSYFWARTDDWENEIEIQTINI